MAIYVYKISDGSLQSYCPNDTDQVASDQVLAANGFAKITGAAQLDSTHAWDAPSHSVVVVVASPPYRGLSAFDFINAFTAAEWAAVKASANNGVAKARDMISVAGILDMNNQNVTAALTLFVAQGILTSQRAAAIGAAVAT